jgi:hypothetical protein
MARFVAADFAVDESRDVAAQFAWLTRLCSLAVLQPFSAERLATARQACEYDHADEAKMRRALGLRHYTIFRSRSADLPGRAVSRLRSALLAGTIDDDDDRRVREARAIADGAERRAAVEALLYSLRVAVHLRAVSPRALVDFLDDLTRHCRDMACAAAEARSRSLRGIPAPADRSRATDPDCGSIEPAGPPAGRFLTSTVESRSASRALGKAVAA